ncbi:MAG: EamA family transporter [Burkholderiales bacterium]|nr:EamA family transporter [Burkholderiales bacterium]
MSTREFSPVLALLLGASLWGVVWYPLRLLEAQGFYPVWLTFTTYAAATLIGLALMTAQPHSFRTHAWTLLALALAGGCTNIAFVLAVLDGNVMRVLLLFYLSPLWAVVLGWLLLKEPISWRSVSILALAMAGAISMLWDPSLGMPWPRDQADWLAIGSGFAFAVSNVIVRGAQEVSIAYKVVSTWLGVVVLAAILIALLRVPVPDVTVPVTVAALVLGALGISVMTVLVQYGVTRIPIHRSAVILLFELVAGALSQQLLTDEVMTFVEWFGGGLIVLAAYLSAKL